MCICKRERERENGGGKDNDVLYATPWLKKEVLDVYEVVLDVYEVVCVSRE